SIARIGEIPYFPFGFSILCPPSWSPETTKPMNFCAMSFEPHYGLRGTRVIYEICVDSVAGVRAAKAAGANRVELCGDLLEGGTTPSRGMIHRARTVAAIRLHVIIRPRGGDFLFDDDEVAVMEADIDAAKAEGADGVVIGLLAADGQIDVVRTSALIA